MQFQDTGKASETVRHTKTGGKWSLNRIHKLIKPLIKPVRILQFLAVLLIFALVIYTTVLGNQSVSSVICILLTILSGAYVLVLAIDIISQLSGGELQSIPMFLFSFLGILFFGIAGFLLISVYSASALWSVLTVLCLSLFVSILFVIDVLTVVVFWKRSCDFCKELYCTDQTEILYQKSDTCHPKCAEPVKHDLMTSVSSINVPSGDEEAVTDHSRRKVGYGRRRQYADRETSAPSVAVVEFADIQTEPNVTRNIQSQTQREIKEMPVQTVSKCELCNRQIPIFSTSKDPTLSTVQQSPCSTCPALMQLIRGAPCCPGCVTGIIQVSQQSQQQQTQRQKQSKDQKPVKEAKRWQQPVDAKSYELVTSEQDDAATKGRAGTITKLTLASYSVVPNNTTDNSSQTIAVNDEKTTKQLGEPAEVEKVKLDTEKKEKTPKRQTEMLIPEKEKSKTNDSAKKLSKPARKLSETTKAKQIESTKKQTENVEGAENAKGAENSKGGENAKVEKNAKFSENSKGGENAQVEKNSKGGENSKVEKNTKFAENSKGGENSKVEKNAKFAENSKGRENAKVEKNGKFAENSKGTKNAKFSENAKVTKNAKFSDNVKVTENAKVAKNSKVTENAKVVKNAKFSESVIVAENAKTAENAETVQNAKSPEELTNTREETATISSEKSVDEPVKITGEGETASVKKSDERKMSITLPEAKPIVSPPRLVAAMINRLQEIEGNKKDTATVDDMRDSLEKLVDVKPSRSVVFAKRPNEMFSTTDSSMITMDSSKLSGMSEISEESSKTVSEKHETEKVERSAESIVIPKPHMGTQTNAAETSTSSDRNKRTYIFPKKNKVEPAEVTHTETDAQTLGFEAQSETLFTVEGPMLKNAGICRACNRLQVPTSPSSFDYYSVYKDKRGRFYCEYCATPNFTKVLYKHGDEHNRLQCAGCKNFIRSKYSYNLQDNIHIRKKFETCPSCGQRQTAPILTH